MAKNQKTLRIVLRQNKNEDSKAYGKWYAELLDRETITTRGLAKHISGHGSPFTEDVIIGVLSALSRCIPELVAEGTGVKLDGLGQFYPSLESTGADSPSAFTIQENVKGVHIRWCHRDRRMTSNLDSYHRQEIVMPDVRVLLCHIGGRPARTARKAV